MMIGKLLNMFDSMKTNYSKPSENTSQLKENNNRIARVQVQDQSGMWRDTATTIQDSQIYLARMQEATQNHPGMRVRTVDDNGRLLDML